MVLETLNVSSTLAATLESNDCVVQHWTADDGRSALLFNFGHGAHRVVLLPNEDGKRFDFAPLPATIED